MATAIIEHVEAETLGTAATDTATGPAEPVRAAVAYIRVSTKDQATRGGREEGFSIPAQREAILKASQQAGAFITEWFIEAGESGTSTAHRPELRRMLDHVKHHKVDLCYVHKLDRLARNREDDVAINLALRQAGVKLVSCTENIDATPTGALVHGIMASISEFYSRNLSTEVSKGLRQKAIAGGTPHRAPLGYLNIRRRDENGREYRTVDVDPARAPLVAWAFEAYATGQWTLKALSDELTLRGLTTLPTPKRPAKAVGPATLQKILRNPYYKGDLVYKGARHAGTQDPLIKPLLWVKVQDMLDAHNVAGDRQRVNDHYLKGSLYCQCGARMSITMSRSKNGDVYPYFYCLGRQRKNGCQMQAVLVTTVEDLVTQHYQDIQLDPNLADALEGMSGDIIDQRQRHSDIERRALETQKTRLENAEQKLIQLFYDDAITMPAMKTEQKRVADQLAEVTDRLDSYKAGCVDARLRLRSYLALAAHCHRIYDLAGDTQKRQINHAFFTKIILTEDHRIETSYTGVVETILDPANRLHADYWQRHQQLHPAILGDDALTEDTLNRSGVRVSQLWWS